MREGIPPEEMMEFCALVPKKGKEFGVQKCSFLAGAQISGCCVARAVLAAARPAAGKGLHHTGV